jgi:hypothetical protein
MSRGAMKTIHVIPMILFCPVCHERHLDENGFGEKPHHTHACQHCGFVWRPSVIPTVGVQFLPGFKNGQPKTSELEPSESIPCSTPDCDRIALNYECQDMVRRCATCSLAFTSGITHENKTAKFEANEELEDKIGDLEIRLDQARNLEKVALEQRAGAIKEADNYKRELADAHALIAECKRAVHDALNVERTYIEYNMPGDKGLETCVTWIRGRYDKEAGKS